MTGTRLMHPGCTLRRHWISWHPDVMAGASSAY
jgi:hypothetical protein